MINWINGNAPPGFFQCLVNHDGVFSFESSYYSTEELYFMQHEFGGVPWAANSGPRANVGAPDGETKGSGASRHTPKWTAGRRPRW